MFHSLWGSLGEMLNFSWLLFSATALWNMGRLFLPQEQPSMITEEEVGEKGVCNGGWGRDAPGDKEQTSLRQWERRASKGARGLRGTCQNLESHWVADLRASPREVTHLIRTQEAGREFANFCIPFLCSLIFLRFISFGEVILMSDLRTTGVCKAKAVFLVLSFLKERVQAESSHSSADSTLAVLITVKKCDFFFLDTTMIWISKNMCMKLIHGQIATLWQRGKQCPLKILIACQPLHNHFLLDFCCILYGQRLIHQ